MLCLAWSPANLSQHRVHQDPRSSLPETMSLYRYRPLESKRHIWLLKLCSNSAREVTGEAGSPHDSLVAEIHHVCLDDANLPPYEPVSYVCAGYTPKSYINADESNTTCGTPPSETSRPSKCGKRDQQILLMPEGDFHDTTSMDRSAQHQSR
jgi:hypothetical protein